MKKDRRTEGWVQTDERITTAELERVPLVEHARVPKIESEGVRHGFTFGDGWVRKDRGTSIARFMPTDHDREAATYFDRVRWRPNGRGHAYGLPGHYKTLPVGCSPAYARGFTAGLIAADGKIEKSGGVLIYCEGAERAAGIAEIARLGGCVVSSVLLDDAKPTNYSPVGTISRSMMAVRIKPATAPIIGSDRRARLKTKHQMRRMYREVVSIEPDGFDEVFCAVVPGSESFTLASGIATSNCGFCPTPQRCPIPREAREDGAITSAEEARVAAATILVAETTLTKRRKALKAWCTNHGPVEVKNAKGRTMMGFEQTERTDRPSAEDIEKAESEKGAPLTSREIKALYKTTHGSRFGSFTPKPQLEDEEDERLMDSLQESLRQATGSVPA